MKKTFEIRFQLIRKFNVKENRKEDRALFKASVIDLNAKTCNVAHTRSANSECVASKSRIDPIFSSWLIKYGGESCFSLCNSVIYTDKITTCLRLSICLSACLSVCVCLSLSLLANRLSYALLSYPILTISGEILRTCSGYFIEIRQRVASKNT